jgi:hypothetical protein
VYDTRRVLVRVGECRVVLDLLGIKNEHVGEVPWFRLILCSLQQSDSLPFFDALTEEQIQAAFEDEGVSGEPRGVDQDVVKKICFDDQNVEVREFLLKGSHRHGMDDIKRRFEADRIGQELLAVLLRIGD